MNFAKIASETARVHNTGVYASGTQKIQVGHLITDAATRTELIKQVTGGKPGPTTQVEVTTETSVAAALRLAGPRTWLLNFASARNIGGGWLSGAEAQEESIARVSGLVPCLETQPEYYQANNACGHGFYTDMMILSPDVPFFRDDQAGWLPVPKSVTVLSAPAPNKGALSAMAPARLRPALKEVLDRRARSVVQLASERGCQTLILGAWGCGVFRNDPEQVAMAFWDALNEFKVNRVVFAIRGPENPLVHGTFKHVFCLT